MLALAAVRSRLSHTMKTVIKMFGPIANCLFVFSLVAALICMRRSAGQQLAVSARLRMIDDG